MVFVPIEVFMMTLPGFVSVTEPMMAAFSP